MATTDTAEDVLGGNPQEPFQSMPVGGQLQEPQEQPPSQINNYPNIPKQSSVSRVYHGILSALGGSYENSYSVDPNTGQTIQSQMRKSPGSQWKQIMAGALIGLGAGGQTNRPGAQGLAGAGAGFAASSQHFEGQDQQKRAQATQEFQQQQTAKLNQANLHRAGLEAIKTEHDLEQARINDPLVHKQLAQAVQNGALAIEQKISELGLTNPRVVRSYEDVTPQDMQDFKENMVKIVANGDGTVTVYDRQFDPASTPNTEDFQIVVPVRGKDGKVTDKILGTVPKGQGTILQNELALKNYADQSMAIAKADAEKAKLESETKENLSQANRPGGLTAPQVMAAEDRLRDDYDRDVLPYRQMLDSADRAIDAMKPGAGGASDLVLLYTVINQMDNTAVREGETALVQSMVGIKGQLEVLYNKQIKGETVLLPESLRKQITTTIGQFQKFATKRKADVGKRFGDTATRRGLDKRNVTAEGIGEGVPTGQQGDPVTVDGKIVGYTTDGKNMTPVQ